MSKELEQALLEQDDAVEGELVYAAEGDFQQDFDDDDEDALDDIEDIRKRGKSFSSWESHFSVDGDDKANAVVRKFRQVFRTKGVRFFYTVYFLFTLVFAMTFVALNNTDNKSGDSFCGSDGYAFLMGNQKFLSNCALEFLFAYPQEFTLLLTLLFWTIAFNPFDAPRRPRLLLGSSKQFVFYLLKLLCAFLVCVIPDPRTINLIFLFDREDIAGEPIEDVIIMSDVLRSLTWLLIFLMLILCYLKQVQIPMLIRQFSVSYFVYRVLWMVFIITNPDKNDSRLYFEATSLFASFVVCLLLIMAVWYPSLEPFEGKIPKLLKKKNDLHWPTMSETWDLLGTSKARLVAILCIIFAVAEGVIRVLTFQELGRALVSCPPTLATCVSTSFYTGPQYHILQVASLSRLTGLFGFAFSVAFFRGIGRTFNAYLFQTTINRLKERLYNASLGCTRLYVAAQKNELNQTIHYYLDREFLKCLLQQMPEAVVPIVQLVTSVVVLFSISWRISILVASIIIVFAMFTVWRNFYTALYQKAYLSSRDRERSMTQDVFNGFEAVQLYAQETQEIGRFRKILNQTMKHATRLYFVDIMGDFTESQILTGAVVCGVAYGTVLASKSSAITPTELAMYATVSFNVLAAVKQLTQFVTQLGKATYASDRTLKLVEPPNPADLDKLPSPQTAMELTIKFENVFFAYVRPENPTENIDYKLRGVDLEIPQGRSVGLVGHTGCGKSTLIKLLLKEYAVHTGEGRLVVGDRDITLLSSRWLYDKIAYVPQKPIIFDENIFYNLVYGWPRAEGAEHPSDLATADREALFDLIRVVKLDEILEPGNHGKDYIMLEKKASETSGGQQQRIAIVRALLRKPQLMLLDEITSALDGSTEAKVMQLIREHAKENNATTIIIAHKYRTIEDCDELIVMSQGKVVERGTYQELAAKEGGEFYNLLKSS